MTPDKIKTLISQIENSDDLDAASTAREIGSAIDLHEAQTRALEEILGRLQHLWVAPIGRKKINRQRSDAAEENRQQSDTTEEECPHCHRKY